MERVIIKKFHLGAYYECRASSVRFTSSSVREAKNLTPTPMCGGIDVVTRNERNIEGRPRFWRISSLSFPPGVLLFNAARKPPSISAGGQFCLATKSRH